MVNSILEFLAVFLMTVSNHLFGMVYSLRHPREVQARSAGLILGINWLSALVSILSIGAVVWLQPGGLSWIGIEIVQKSDNFAGMVKGFVLISFFLIAAYFIQKFALGNRNPNEINVADSKRPEVLELIKFYDLPERLAYLSVMMLGVIAEELVYRGYLVLALWNRTGSFVPWAVISILLSIVVHLYQGRKPANLIIHFLYATALVGITLLTRNLFAAITAHLLNNIAFALNVWCMADRQRIAPAETERTVRCRIQWLLFTCLNFVPVLWFLGWAIDLRFTTPG